MYDKNNTMKIFYFLTLIFSVANLPCGYGQVITTFAGTGIAGYSGDGIPAITSELNQPHFITTDHAGNLIIGDGLNNRVRKVDGTTGIIITVAGTGVTGIGVPDGTAATAANIFDPEGVAADAAGNIYFLNPGADDRILKINAAGIISTYVGNVSMVGYVGDGGPATAALIGLNVNSIATDGAGNLYIADRDNNRVRMVNTLGIITTIAGNGTAGYSGDGGPATNAHVRPWSVSADAAGNVYISDRTNYVVRKVDPSGNISTVAGNGAPGFSGDGSPATAAMLECPMQTATDATGNLFICESTRRRVRMVSPAGIITTIAGNGVSAYAGDGGPATACSLHGPMGIAVVSGSCGERIYISDNLDHRIREIVFNNALPVFTAGHIHYITICGAAPYHLDSLLTMTDGDLGQPETWTLVLPPGHGAVTGSYSATSTGGSLTPTGFIYTPASGFTGADTFRIAVNDCGNAPDTATFYISVAPLPNAGVIKNIEGISGVDTVCIGDTLVLTDSVTGGIWGVYHSKATVSATGIVTGVTPGIDTVSYTVADTCGTAVARHKILVKDCHVSINDPGFAHGVGFSVFPNPNDGTFTVTLPTAGTGSTHIVVTNMVGEKVQEVATTGNSAQLKLDVPSGMYFVNVCADAYIFNTKIVVAK